VQGTDFSYIELAQPQTASHCFNTIVQFIDAKLITPTLTKADSTRGLTVKGSRCTYIHVHPIGIDDPEVVLLRSVMSVMIGGRNQELP